MKQDEPVRQLLQRHYAHQARYEVSMPDLDLMMLPSVFCPLYTKTSCLLASAVGTPRELRALDMFTGSGYQGLRLAKLGNDVLAVDHSLDAVACARLNAARLAVDSHMKVLQSDVFKAVDGTYDLIIANPPLLPGRPSSMLETAVFDDQMATTRRFLRHLLGFLNPGGRALLILSSKSFGGQLAQRNEFAIAGVTSEVTAELDAGYELYQVFSLTA